MNKIIVLTLMLGFLLGCAPITFPKLSTPKKPETVYNWQEKTSTRPKAVVCGDKIVVVEDTDRTLQVGLETTPQKLSFIQKIGNWLSGLSFIAFLALIACLVLAPGATLAWVVKIAFKWKKAFRETVVAIKEAKAVEKNPELKNTLNAKQSVETKKIVDEIRREI